MRSLTFKLILAFLVVSMTGAALAAALARWATFQEFDRLVLEQAQSDFMADVTAYYQTTGSWAGVAEYIPRRRPPPQAPPPQPPPGNRDRPEPQPPPFAFALVDRGGYVVVPGWQYRIGERIPATELDRGVPLEINGEVVGTVLTSGTPPPLDSREERYLGRINQALLNAALGATALALLLGIFLVRTLTHPLRELTHAIRAVAKGQLKQQVPVRSQDELGELATAFNQMSADLTRSNELRRQMTADIAHDLRTPLTVITGYLESLRDGVLKPNPDWFDVMYNEARHLQRLVEDLRTLSLVDAGELPLNRQLVSPQELLERIAAAYRHPAEQQNIVLETKAEPELPEIKVDPERMVQVLGNLVTNALRHTPAGGQITLSAKPEAHAVQLRVQDNGEGIPPEALQRIFDRFYRGDAARQQQNGESGLGLAIARSLVEAHGGTISVESKRGNGTTFIIELPVHP